MEKWLKDRAQSLSDYLAARRHVAADLSASPSLRKLPWISEQNGRFLFSEWQNLIRESSENRKVLDKIATMLSEVMSPGISRLKQSLILSRLSQMAEASAARLSELEWDASAVDEIRVKTFERGYRNLEDTLYLLLDLDVKIGALKARAQIGKKRGNVLQKEDSLEVPFENVQHQSAEFQANVSSLEHTLKSMKGMVT